MKKLILILLVTFIVIFISVFAFIKSPFFPKAVTDYINGHTDWNVGIGSVSLKEGSRLVISDLLIEEKNKDGFSLNIQHAEIKAHVKGILRKNIEEIVLIKPKLSIPYRKGVSGGISIPFTFNKISINDADLILRLDENRPLHISEISISLDRPLHEKNARLSGNAFIEATDSRISLSAEIDAQRFDFARGKIDVSSIDLGNLFARYPVLFFKNKKITGSATLSVEMDRAKRPETDGITYQTSLSFKGLRIQSDAIALDLKDKNLEIVSQGNYDSKQDKVEIDSFSSRLSQTTLLELRGTIKNISSQAPEMHITADSSDIPIDDIKKIFSGSAVTWLDQTEVNGSADAGLVISGNFHAPDVRGEFSLKGENLAWKNLKLRSVKARLPLLYKNGSLSVTNGSLQVFESVYHNPPDREQAGYKLLNALILIPSFFFDGSIMKSDNFQFHADNASFIDNKTENVEKNIFVTGNVKGEIPASRFRINNLIIKSDFIKGLSGDISILAGRSPVINATFLYKNIDIGWMSKKFSNDLPVNHGWTVTGTGRLKTVITAAFPENGKPQLTGTNQLTLNNGGFSSDDETIMCEGIEMKASNSFEFSLPVNQLRFNIDSDATKFELLAGKFYGNFEDRVLSLSVKGAYVKENDSVQITESKLGLTHIGNIFMAGTISKVTEKPLIDAHIRITDFDNSEAYNFFIRDTFREEFPALALFEMDGGSSADLDITGTSGRFKARGEFQTTDMNISNKNHDKAISGISLSLPVSIEYPEVSQTRRPVRFGALKLTEAAWSGIKFKEIEVNPSLWDNNLTFSRDVTVPVLGGDIIIRNISFNNIFSPERQLGFSIDIKNIDLGQASVAFSLPRFNGKLSGSISGATLYQNRLLADGEINMDLFGGSVRISDLSVDNILSPVASLKTDIEFNGIDLGQLTSTFDFGHISGLVRGNFHDLVIVNGQAQRFNAFLESYARKGIAQTINVEALRKISILGTGSSPSILDRGIYRFFKEYKYEKLGFRASLKNDHLLLLGIERDGSKGYLVKSGLLPPKVDVINYTQDISFKEMVSRLKRLKQI